MEVELKRTGDEALNVGSVGKRRTGIVLGFGVLSNWIEVVYIYSWKSGDWGKK